MSNSIAIVAGFFLMIGSLALLFETIIFMSGGTHILLVPAIKIAGVVVLFTTLVGLFDKRVFRNAVTWIGVW